ncbi:MAG: hypothetical protein HY736_23075 [Verrucomicrobia bacterium]|nr:hypothetical protein [Verrucomicrobiota bacterium]
MKLRAGVSWLPKRGNSAEEYEDAFYPKTFDPPLVLPFSCAIADGAAATSFSGLWANLLTERFCRAGDLKAFDQLLPELREKWDGETRSKPFPWYIEQQLEQGAFATLLGVQIIKVEVPAVFRWQAIAVGDSCLFHVKGFDLAAAFPPFKAEDLKARPMLLSSRPMPDSATELYRFADGNFEPGDRLYLVSDAVAGWILQGVENDTKPFVQLDQVVRNPDFFLALIERLLNQRELKNDDFTLLWVEALSGDV